jgi:syntaxin 18
MDRTKEFFSFVGPVRQHEAQGYKKRFYETFDENIAGLTARASKASSFRAALALETEFMNLQKQISSIFEATRVEGSADIVAHYEGVKQILNMRLLQLSHSIGDAKGRACGHDVELAPERPASFRNVCSDVVLEQENRRIVEHQEYEVVRQRLQKIDAVQKAINESLVIQDERIDSICNVTGSTGEIYGLLAGDDGFDSGSIMRRAVFVILLCLSFVLLFLHFFYK